MWFGRTNLSRQGLDQYLKDDYLGLHSIFHSLMQSKQSLNISQTMKFQFLSCQPVHVKMDDMPHEDKGLILFAVEVTNKSPINFRESSKETKCSFKQRWQILYRCNGFTAAACAQASSPKDRNISESFWKLKNKPKRNEDDSQNGKVLF